MTDPIPGKRFGALHAWPDGDGWSYLPVAPSPQRGPDGRVQLTAVEAADMLMLTLGTNLVASEADLAQVQAAIAAGADPGAPPVRLRAANATPRGATLTLVLDGKAPVELARANPSPLAPYSAAFSAMLRGDQAKQANAAMKDGTGRLEVAYDLDLATNRSVTARIAGDPAGVEDVEAALKNGDLTLTFEADPGVSEALMADARASVIDDVARILRQMPEPAVAQAAPFGDCPETDPPGPGATTETNTAAIDAFATRTEPSPRSVRVAANVADWL